MRKLVGAYEFDLTWDDGELAFRIEVFSEAERSSVRLYRRESFALVPSFGAGGIRHADAEIFIVDDFWDWSQQFDGPQAAIGSLLGKLQQQLPTAPLPRPEDFLE